MCFCADHIVVPSVRFGGKLFILIRGLIQLSLGLAYTGQYYIDSNQTADMHVHINDQKLLFVDHMTSVWLCQICSGRMAAILQLSEI